MQSNKAYNAGFKLMSKLIALSTQAKTKQAESISAAKAFMQGIKDAKQQTK